MRFRTKQFLADENAATAIEYALIASLIAVAIIGVLNNTAARLRVVFSEVASALK